MWKCVSLWEKNLCLCHLVITPVSNTNISNKTTSYLSSNHTKWCRFSGLQYDQTNKHFFVLLSRCSGWLHAEYVTRAVCSTEQLQNVFHLIHFLIFKCLTHPCTVPALEMWGAELRAQNVLAARPDSDGSEKDECLTNANSDRRTFSGTKSGSKRDWLHVCTHRRCGWWPQTGRNSSLSRCPSPASSPLPEEEDKTERGGFKDCATGLEHQRTHLDGWRGYLVDLISGGVFPHSHGQRSFVGHGYPQLHIRHAVKVLGHREEKVWSARLVADGRSRCDTHS